MATLVLTTVGTLIGGPIGGAIGAALGSQVDRLVFSPSRKGPRLGDLSVQTSSYGSTIPKVFGTMRVAGTVIWATDLREDVHRSGSKAGKTTTYSYSASLAVALSGRPIIDVGRIWADGKLLRGSDGGWRSETGFRLYRGGEDQPIDPLIGAAQGIDSTPAHRGVALAVFEGLQLADYGNRIPSLSFEVIADAGPPTVTAIAAELSDETIAARATGLRLDGYAASGESVRGAIEALQQAAPLALRDDGARLTTEPLAVTPIPGDALGATTGDHGEPRTTHERKGTAALPDAVTLGYYEPARDWQAGLQRARRDGAATRDARIELPAAVSAAIAKGLAEAALGRAWAERESATVQLPWRFAEARAGSRVRLSGRTWRISRWSLEKMAIRLALSPEMPEATAIAATAGDAAPNDQATAGATVVRLVDLPVLDGGDPSTPQIFAATAGTEPGWRRAELAMSLDDGASWNAVGRTALPAIMGNAVDAAAPGPLDLLDERATVTVALLHDGMALAGCDRDGLVAGRNLALLGDELLQFGRAEQIGPALWRLGRLLRGRHGTEGAIAGHAAGDAFLLIEAATLQPIAVPASALGTTVRVSATGPGDTQAIEAALPVAGRAIRPPAPIRLSARRSADGTLRFAWTRRSRIGWSWLDGIDSPLGEDSERYRLTITGAGGGARTVETDAPGYDYAPADQAADGIAGTIGASLAQIGTRAASLPPATASWTL